MSRISVCTPAHRIPETDGFLHRIRESLDKQTFRDFDWIVTWEGSMPVNSNNAIKKAKGEVVKILYMDDYLFSEKALENIDEAFKNGAKWAVSGCVHDNGQMAYNPHYPKWSEEVLSGVNTIGSPSVLAFLNDDPLLFDERMSWMLDLDLYRRLHERYGPPTIINQLDVAIGIGYHQMTHKLSEEEKQKEITLYHGTTN